MPNIRYKIERRGAGGYAEISLRFYAGRDCDQQAKTGVFVPVALWDNDAQRLKISKRYETPDTALARKAQRRLEELTEHIFAAFVSAAKPLPSDWLRTTIAAYINPALREPPLADFIEAYCDAKDTTPATRRKMRALGTHLREFSRATGTPMSATTITASTLEAFARWLQYGDKEHDAHGVNSVVSRLKQLRALLYWRGKPTPNPFDGYTMPAEVYGTPIYLTKDERDYLYLYNDLTARQKIQRDIFIFQCHTGCRIADLYSLTLANIQDGWLVYIPQKTKRDNPSAVEVPLSDTALEIVERYRHADLRGRLFPFICPQKYDQAIHSVLKAAALDRAVMYLDPRTFETRQRPLYEVATSHTARKTFIQIMYAATGEKRLVAAMSGHAENSQAFNRYSEVTREMKRAALLKTQPDANPTTDSG